MRPSHVFLHLFENGHLFYWEKKQKVGIAPFDQKKSTIYHIFGVEMKV